MLFCTTPTEWGTSRLSTGSRVADLVREAIRKTVLKPGAGGLVALLDGEPKRVSTDHDSMHDQP